MNDIFDNGGAAGNPRFTTADNIKSLLIPRRYDAHKHSYGHILLVCGSTGMSGAAVLAAGGALRSGCGLVTVHMPHLERFALSGRFPSAMLSLDGGDCFSQLPAGLEKYNAIGVGCGLGTATVTVNAFAELLQWGCGRDVPFVIDADGLNILAQNPYLQQFIPKGSVLTPHDGELKRLVGNWTNYDEKINAVRALAHRLGVVVVSKGPNTAVCNAQGEVALNSSGNSGMAKGGSGDILTGLITGLLGRGYSAFDAARIGVYLHGLAGDLARLKLSAEAMNSGDILDFLPDAWLTLE